MPGPVVLVPLITPLDGAGAVCRESVGRLVTQSGLAASGYVPCLSSGEGWRLSRRQWEAMVRYTLELAGPGAVIVGALRPTTAEVVEYGALARRLGARAIMLTAPFGGGLDQQGIFAHYREVHDALDLEIYIYNETSLSGHETAFETLLAVAELPRVVGIKDSIGVDAPERGGRRIDGRREASQIAALRRRGLAYYIGWEHHLAGGVPVDGCVVALANLEPALCRLGLLSAEAAVRAELLRLSEAYSLRAEDWYRSIKQVLRARGVIASECTLAESRGVQRGGTGV